MERKKIILSILLCVFSLGLTVQAEIKDTTNTPPTASEQAQIAELTEFAEDILIKAFNALQKIENRLTEIALLIKKGSFLKLATSGMKVMEVLTANKKTINALLQSQAAIISLKDPIKHLEVAHLLSEFCNEFIPYLSQQIKDNFKNARPFNLNNFLKNLNRGKKRTMSHLEPASLTKQLNATRSKLRGLDITVQNIGLTWYNKAARAVDSYVVTPANKYHIPTLGFYGGGITSLSFYILWRYGHLIKEGQHTPPWLNNLIESLHANNRGPLWRDKVGAPYLVGESNSSPSGEGESNPSPSVENANNWGGREQTDLFNTKSTKKATLFAGFDFAINDLMSQNQPLISMGATFLIGSFYKAWTGGISDKLTKKRDALWNFLRGGEYLKSFKPGMAELKPTVSFKDMVGLEEVKEAFYSILQYIDNPEQLMRIEATPEKGWLLTGPSRTGKTFSVECLCGEIELMMQKRGLSNKMKFFNVSAALVNDYGIKAILDEVRENAPAVIFIDEIDLLGLQRVGNNKLLSDFLTAMQSSMNADPSKIVIVIAATNNPQNIDKALRQNGRFGKEIRFEYPGRKYRIQYIIRELTNMALDIAQFDPKAIADKTNGKTFEDLKAVIRHAMTRSWMNGASLSQKLLDDSIDTEIHHIIPFGRKELTDDELRIIATHFAGRALAAMHLNIYEQLDKVTILARMTDLQEEGVWENYTKKDEKEQQQKIEYGAFITKQFHDSINVKSEATIINEAIVLIAGFAAEELLLGSCGFTCHRNNNDRAYKLIEDLIFGGLNQATLPKSVREELKTKTYNLLRKCHEDAMDLLRNHKDALTALIDELMAKRILDDKEIQLIIDKAEGRIVEDTTNVTSPENAAETNTEISTQVEITPELTPETATK